ncbi:MAG: hypothetical protein U9P50_02485 [Patescibacteria group bacterium]|nr:hypothetical protein [Patescibacteria group bacterium]
MKKGFGVTGIFLIVTIIAISGVVYYLQKIESTTETDSKLSEECRSFGNDTCSLFSCMTSNCWCKEGPLGGVVYEKKVIVEDEIDAEKIAIYYLTSINSGYNKVVEVVKSNSNFFNVVIRDDLDNKKYLTVSKDGKILETICGI